MASNSIWKLKRMMKAKIFLAVVGLGSISILAGCSGGGSGGGGEILATVDKEPITIDQFNTYLGVKSTVRVAANGQVVELPVVDTLAFQAMQDLVSRTTLFQMAKDEGVMPDEKDVEKEISYQNKLDPNFMATYKAKGMTLSQIREEVKFSLVQERLITKGITVSADEVNSWIQKNPEALIIPANATLSWILAQNDARKASVDEALSAGGKFGDVAAKLSQDPNAAVSNGRFQGGPIAMNRMAANLKAPIEKTNVGGDTDWIKFNEGWAKFHVDAKDPEKKLELTPERKENIQRNLALQKGNKANDLRKRLVDRIQASDVVVRRPALKDQWSNFSKLLKQQAEQSVKAASPNTTNATPVQKTGGDVVPTGN